MDQSEENVSHIEYFPLNDFSEFGGENPPLSDCKLILNDGNVIPSHTLILARGSQFFESAFTSGMAEDVNREVNVTFNPQNLFPAVVNYLYSGNIEVEQDQIMSLLAIAKYYGISSLYNEVAQRLQDEIDSNNIISFIEQCYNNELASELDYLIPRISELLQDINMAALSENLDLPTFCRILQHYNGLPAQKVELFILFIGDYQCTENDIKPIINLFNSSSSADMEIFCTILEHYDCDPDEKIRIFSKFNGDHKCSKQDYPFISKILDFDNPDVISALRTLKPKWASDIGIHVK